MKRLAKLLGFDNNESATNVDAPNVNEINSSKDEQNTVTVNTNMSNIRTDVIQANITDIQPNPYQPRKSFSEESLQELADSIYEHGILQPLIVRKFEEGYQLIAGERRLRASKIVGLDSVPVIVKDLSEREIAEIAMIENLQREDLHFLEEALGYQQLISTFGLTQDELAKRVGKNQSTIANKLRLLKLSPEVQSILREEKLTERHARSLLKLDDPKEQVRILEFIKDKNLNVRETEDMIAELSQNISQEIGEKPKQNIVKIIKDVRIFINTINQVVSEMKKTGLKIKMQQTQSDDFVTIELKIPKRR